MFRKICHWIIFRLLGWKQEGEVPTLDKFLLVAVPHTSNWDFVIGWTAAKALGLDLQIFVKDMYFFGPLKYISPMFGVLPVNRRKSTNFTDAAAMMFKNADKLQGLITPEGTRSRVDNLKSGYYHLAKKAGVKIVVAGPHFSKKIFTFLPARDPLATFEEDAANVIEFCKTQDAYHRENSFQ